MFCTKTEKRSKNESQNASEGWPSQKTICEQWGPGVRNATPHLSRAVAPDWLSRLLTLWPPVAQSALEESTPGARSCDWWCDGPHDVHQAKLHFFFRGGVRQKEKKKKGLKSVNRGRNCSKPLGFFKPPCGLRATFLFKEEAEEKKNLMRRWLGSVVGSQKW